MPNNALRGKCHNHHRRQCHRAITVDSATEPSPWTVPQSHHCRRCHRAITVDSATKPSPWTVPHTTHPGKCHIYPLWRHTKSHPWLSGQHLRTHHRALGHPIQVSATLHPPPADITSTHQECHSASKHTLLQQICALMLPNRTIVEARRCSCYSQDP